MVYALVKSVTACVEKRKCVKFLQIIFDFFQKALIILVSFYGECSSVGRAPGCGSGGRGFDPHHSPHLLRIFFNKCLA